MGRKRGDGGGRGKDDSVRQWGRDTRQCETRRVMSKSDGKTHGRDAPGVKRNKQIGNETMTR